MGILVVDVSFIYDLGNGKVILMSCKHAGRVVTRNFDAIENASTGPASILAVDSLEGWGEIFSGPERAIRRPL